MTKTLVIGLDGGTFDIIKPLIKEGKLPNISRIMDNGAHGILKSTTPPVTPVAWASFMTGVNPGKHGIFDFIEQKADSYDLTWSKMSTRYKTLWSLISDAGKKAIVVNVPMTYPPEKINGIMISGMGTPGADSDFVHPQKLRETLNERFGAYKIDIDARPDDPGTYYKDVLELTVQHGEISKYLISNYEWDFFMVVFIGTDRMQHNMWRHMDESHPEYDPDDAEKYGGHIFELYQEVDGIIGDLIGRIDEDACVFIVSDHGFGPLYKRVHINKWLGQQGLFRAGDRELIENDSVRYRLSRDASGRGNDDLIELEAKKPDRYAMAAVTKSLNLDRQYLIKVTARGSIDGVALEFNDFSNSQDPIIGGSNVTTKFLEYSTVFTPVKKKTTVGAGITSYAGNPPGSIFIKNLSLKELDWSEIQAYTFGVSDHVHINLKGREPRGTVESGEEYENLRNDIIERLYALEDGGKIVDRVFKREELYHGEMLESAPDLTLRMKNYSYRSYNSFDLKGELFEKPTLGHSGDHRIEGILVANGKGIKRAHLPEAEITDVVPTILGVLGIPIPANLDGKVLEELFEPGVIE
ncbi:MAG: alkaline phosphatase family protein, partial [Candidatus Hydrothermarchaeaceae archaeon]